MTPEADWLAFLRRRKVPRLEEHRHEGALPRLVVVAPHPDDEVLACGGLAARHAASGGAVLLVAVTDGEASHPGDARWPTARLASARRAESVRGLARLGLAAAPVVRLGLPDGDVGAENDRLQTALRDILRPGDRVVTTWRHDGHPDHQATGAAVARVAGEARIHLIEAPVWMWHHRRPDDPAVPWAQLRALPLTAAELRAKQRALSEHRTQSTPRADGVGPVLDEAILARAGRDSEYFFAGAA